MLTSVFSPWSVHGPTSDPAKTSVARFLPILLSLTFLAIPLTAQNSSWLGTNSSDWRDSTNWSGGIPDMSTATLVSYGAPSRHDLEVPHPMQGDTVRVGDLTIQHKGRIVFSSLPDPGILIVHGNVLSLNGGELLLGDGRILFKQDVRMNNGGAIDAGDGTLEFQGDVDVQGGSTFTAGSSLVIFSGDSDQTVSGDLQLHDVVVTTDGELNLTGNTLIQGSITIDSGTTVRVDSGCSVTIEGDITGDGEFVPDSSATVVTGIHHLDDRSLPISDILYPGYPNPFNPRSTLTFSLKDPGRVRLTIHDITGRRLVTLFDGTRESGTHSITWDAGGYASGVYICRLITSRMVLSRRLILLQ